MYTHRLGISGSPRQRPGLFVHPISILFGNLYTSLESDRLSVTTTTVTTVARQQSPLHPPLPSAAPSLILGEPLPDEKDTLSNRKFKSSIRGGSCPTEFATQMNNENTSASGIAVIVLRLKSYPHFNSDSLPIKPNLELIHQEHLSAQGSRALVFHRIIPFYEWRMSRKHEGKVQKRGFSRKYTAWKHLSECEQCRSVA